MHRPHGSRPLLADRGPAARRALGIAPRRGARRRAPRRPQRSGPPPPMGLEWRALHACAAGAPAGRAARGSEGARGRADRRPGRRAAGGGVAAAGGRPWPAGSLPEVLRGFSGPLRGALGSRRRGGDAGLPVGGAGVGGGEHCDPVVVGHCALRETTTAGAGAGSAGACAVLCSVVVRPELRSVRRGPLHTSRITEEVKVPISLPFARFSLCWASSEALVATVGFASKFLSGRTPGKVQGVAVPVPSGFPRIGCC
ncbi:unnamed protein product [Prorocentrum cordatum]|uniref:Translation initiation factor IF-2-like n=1 Tax=Prorocentrum cordatum TaxID=2364126 RepID=A0ABN9X4H1_9DINO|nr:unnamed protein product [Polarella glacialis]